MALVLNLAETVNLYGKSKVRIECNLRSFRGTHCMDVHLLDLLLRHDARLLLR